MAGHALLSPSGASRWLVCTPSARMEQEFPNSTNQAAEEGTTAHLLCETLLNQFLKPEIPKAYKKKFAEVEKSMYYNAEMLQHAEDYCGAVLADLGEGEHIFVEQRLDISNYVPESFGTGDVIIIGNKILKFWDLKYGKGVPVFAPNNKQLMLYAVGALNDFGNLFDIETVKLNIYQPRLQNHSTWEISVKDLLAWAETELKEKAQMAYEGEGELVLGEHCRFCRAKARCRAMAELNMSLAKEAFRNPNLLTDAELLEVMGKADLVATWVKAINDYALAEALQGKKWDGYKLVEGKSNRQYVDEEKIASSLTIEGYEDIYSEPTLLGITALEKKIGKKTFTQLVEPYLIKPPGKPALVPATDKRPEYNSAVVAFKEPITDN